MKSGLHKRITGFVSTACIGLAVAGCHQAPDTENLGASDTFPAFRARSLARQDVAAPNDLPPGSVLVLIGFSPKAQQDMDLWIGDAKKHRLAVVEVPVIYDPIVRPFVGFLEREMRKSTPPEIHNMVWLVTDDADLLEHWVGGHETDYAYAYLLDSTRRVVQTWQTGYPGESALQN